LLPGFVQRVAAALAAGEASLLDARARRGARSYEGGLVVLQGEAKRDYMRAYMRKRRAGEPTQKPKP
jgi:hypothetical protein